MISSLLTGIPVDCWSAEVAVATLLYPSVLISRTTVCPTCIRLVTVKIWATRAGWHLKWRNGWWPFDGEWWEPTSIGKGFPNSDHTGFSFVHICNFSQSFPVISSDGSRGSPQDLGVLPWTPCWTWNTYQCEISSWNWPFGRVWVPHFHNGLFIRAVTN